MPNLEALLEEIDEFDEAAFGDLVARLDKELQQRAPGVIESKPVPAQPRSSARASFAHRGSASNRQKGMSRVQVR